MNVQNNHEERRIVDTIDNGVGDVDNAIMTFGEGVAQKGATSLQSATIPVEVVEKKLGTPKGSKNKRVKNLKRGIEKVYPSQHLKQTRVGKLRKLVDFEENSPLKEAFNVANEKRNN